MFATGKVVVNVYNIKHTIMFFSEMSSLSYLSLQALNIKNLLFENPYLTPFFHNNYCIPVTIIIVWFKDSYFTHATNFISLWIALIK